MEYQKLTTRIGKIISGTKKPDEGFATIFVYEPKDYLEKQHGKLYFLIEVLSGSKTAPEVGETVINSIKEEFYFDLERSVIGSFESALRKANEELSDLASAGDTDWVGKLNVVCAVLSEGKLHMAKVGAAEAYIIRTDKITHISEGLSVDEEKDDHPLKTFSTITSGSLQKDDKLILSSPDLFYHISLAGFKKLVQENTPSGAIVKLKELLKDEEGIGSIGVLIIELTTEEELSKQNRHEVDEIWIEEPKPTEAAMGFLAGIMAGGKKLFESAKNKLSPASKATTPPTPPIENVPTETISTGEKPREEKAKEEKTSQPADGQKKENFISFVVSYFKNFSLKKFLADIKKALLKLKSIFKDKMHSTYFKLFAITALLFFLSLTFILGNFYANKNSKEMKTKLDKAISLENDAENALIYEARQEAKNYLDESKILTEEILKTKYYTKEALDLIKKIEEAYQKADGITEVSPNLVLELDKDAGISNVTFLNKTLYFLNPKNNQLISYNIESKEQQPLETSQSQGTFSKITTFPKQNLILLLNDAGELYEFNVKSNKTSKANAKENFKNGQSMTTYGSNFYILSKEDNQVLRYSRSSTGYSKASNYVTDKTVDIKNGDSLTIPGIVFVLQNDGSVTKLISGKKQEFGLKEIPFAIKSPLKILSFEGSDKIYILDRELGVLVFSVNGKYIKNLRSKDFSDLKDFYVDEASGTIYVISGNKVFSFGK